jgi:rhodanese-related sulfurtransferase
MAHVVQRALLIILLGATLGLLSNAISPNGIRLITPPKKAPKPEEFIPLKQAHDFWEGGNAFFLDARKPEDFEAGHISKAINLPIEEFPEYFPKVAPMLTLDGPIVVYCDGMECELSHRLAAELRQLSYTNTHILFNGWTVWRTAGFPVESAPAK